MLLGAHSLAKTATGILRREGRLGQGTVGRLLPRRRAKESSEKEVEKCVEAMPPGDVGVGRGLSGGHPAALRQSRPGGLKVCGPLDYCTGGFPNPTSLSVGP